MAEETAALSTTAPAAADEREYEIIFATIMESARGRAFLDEYARRNRHADTAQVVGAIGRLEALFHERSPEDDRHLRSELMEMARVIADLRLEDDHEAQRLPAALGYLERRINAMLARLRAEPDEAPPPKPMPADPLAALKALSDEERIALFT